MVYQRHRFFCSLRKGPLGSLMKVQQRKAFYKLIERGAYVSEVFARVPGLLLLLFQQLRFGIFREGVFQKMPALEGQFLKEISVRFARENHLRTQKKHKTKLCAEVPERPLPKDPFFQLLIVAAVFL